MKRIFYLAAFFMMLSNLPAAAQYDFVELTLETSQWTKRYTTAKLNMYHRGGEYFIGSSYRHGADTTLHETVRRIEKATFDEIAKLALAISSADLISGMNISDPSIWNDPSGARLTVRVFHESINYNVIAPDHETKKRHLVVYLEVCKKMLSAADLPVKKIL